jgi:hypothetical protein
VGRTTHASGRAHNPQKKHSIIDNFLIIAPFLLYSLVLLHYKPTFPQTKKTIDATRGAARAAHQSPARLELARGFGAYV